MSDSAPGSAPGNLCELCFGPGRPEGGVCSVCKERMKKEHPVICLGCRKAPSINGETYSALAWLGNDELKGDTKDVMEKLLAAGNCIPAFLIQQCPNCKGETATNG